MEYNVYEQFSPWYDDFVVHIGSVEEWLSDVVTITSTVNNTLTVLDLSRSFINHSRVRISTVKEKLHMKKMKSLNPLTS